MMRLWILLAALALVVGTIACTPDMINHKDGTQGETTVDAVADAGGQDTGNADSGNVDTGKPDAGQTDTGGTDTVATDNGGISCKHDCDCVNSGKVCQDGTCQALRRATACVACDASCTKGDPCLAKDGSISTCPGGFACKDDCDCVLGNKSGPCVNGFCDDRVNGLPTCPNCKDTCSAGTACQNDDGSKGVCSGPVKCKDDCDCRGVLKVCDSNGECAALRRLSTCVACDSKECQSGNRCYNKDESFGTCGGAKACKSDCDCESSEGVCHQGKCDPTLKRAYVCPACDGNCTAGNPCREKDGSTGVCGTAKSCKHDCDCVNLGLVCDSNNKCAALRRQTYCVACTGSCTTGDPCLNPDKSIGVCGGVSCKDDCDCVKSGGVCESGACNKVVARAGNCRACSDTTCLAGTRCFNADKSVGICNKACKHDCDCVPVGMLCNTNGQCAQLRRLSFCYACNSGKCKAGEKCQEQNQSIGVCPANTTYQCGTKTCKTGQEYCTTTTGGVAPSCQSLPPTTGTTCPTGCNNAGLTCTDGKIRCYCPSSSCVAYKQNCTDCACLKSTGQVPQSACQCTDKNGDAHVQCFAP